MEITEAQKKISQIGNTEERSVAELLLNLGFTFVDSNSIIMNTANQRIGEIDLIFTFKDYLFLVEVSKDKHSSNKKSAFFNKWDEHDNLAIVNKQYQLRPRKVMRVYVDLST